MASATTEGEPNIKVNIDNGTGQIAAQPALQQLWRTLLDLPPTQALYNHSHFFELGGGSMLLLSLQVAIAREFAVELAVTALFTNPTLAQMNALLLQAQQHAECST